MCRKQYEVPLVDQDASAIVCTIDSKKTKLILHGYFLQYR